MKVLLDENLPHVLRSELVGHNVFTVQYQGWSGKKNGELLALAVAAGFEVLLTMDSGVKYQQNIASLPLAVVVISANSNDISDLRPLVPKILGVLPHVQARKVVHVS